MNYEKCVDEIVDLPGLSFKPNFKHYSGYLNASETRFLHYWFVESQHTPPKDPLVFWFNGGPGCSSIESLFAEHGPYFPSNDTTILKKNPFAWNKLGDVRGALGSLILFPGQWTTLIKAIHNAVVRSLYVCGVGFSALKANEFLVTIASRGLQSLLVRRSVFPDGFVMDDLVRSCATKGVLHLQFSENKGDTTHTISNSAVLDFFSPTDVEPEDQWRSLALEDPGLTNSFVTNLFESLRSSPVRPCGLLTLYSLPTQRDLSAYAPYLAPDELTTYRFPSIDGENKSYEIKLCELLRFTSLQFCLI